MIHPRDLTADNPRLQCVVCGKWKRLRDQRTGAQRFYGGCVYAHGGDHLARKGTDHDVCEDCCHKKCKELANT
jgi:hypothetical protein